MKTREDQPDTWDGALYAANTGHHRRHDEPFLASLALEPRHTVLDLGAGVGDFTCKIANLVPHGSVLGIDSSASQIAIARARQPANVELLVGRAQDLEALAHGRMFDAVVSRATLHWIAAEEHPALLRSVARCLRPGGLFRAEFGGAGQIRAMQNILDAESKALGGITAPWFFPDVVAYRLLLEQAGFDCGAGQVRLVLQRRPMPTLESLIGYMRSQVFMAYEPSLPPEQRRTFRERCEERARGLERTDGSFDLDFVRLDVSVRRL